MARIFVSYSRSDIQFTQEFVRLLRRVYRSPHVIWSDDEIRGGSRWWATILHEIAQSNLFIYLVSDESLSSQYCQAELQEAVRLNKPVLPVIIRRIEWDDAPSEVRQFVQEIHWIDLSREGLRDTDTLANLFASINTVLEQVSRLSSMPEDSVPTPEPIVADRLNSPASRKTDAIKPPSYPSKPFSYPKSAPAPPRQIVFPMLLFIIPVVVIAIFLAVYMLFLKDGDKGDDRSPTDTIAENVQTEGVDQTEVAAEPTETPDISTLIAQTFEAATATTSFEQTQTAISWTETPTLTATPTETPTTNPISLGFQGNPVTSNDQWEPVIQEFDGMEMVLVPAGSFLMGSNEEEIDIAFEMCIEAAEDGVTCERWWFVDRESPTSTQTFNQPFWIDRTEVTRLMYSECIEAGECSETPTSEFSTNDDQPVNRVNWGQAQEYCAWRGARLPTEAEWEYAARGPDHLIFPWGNELSGSEANHCDLNCVESEWSSTQGYRNEENDDSYAIIAPVGIYLQGISWVGALDMTGNVLEWTNTIYEGYPYNKTDGRESYDPNAIHIQRGGSFYDASVYFRPAFRYFSESTASHFAFGFRCARDFSPEDLNQR